MRSVTVVARQADGWFQSYGQAFADADGITPIAIHSIQLLDDETALVLYELSGDISRVRDILTESTDTIDSLVTDGVESAFAHILFEPTDTVSRFLRIPRERRLTIDTPLAFTGNGGIRITAVGPGQVLREVFSNSAEALHLTIEEVGDYHPPSDRPFARLSDRQQEVLQVAVEMGYYEEPRRVTQADLAEVLDCTAATVGSHLRRIEHTLIPAMAPDPEPSLSPDRP